MNKTDFPYSHFADSGKGYYVAFNPDRCDWCREMIMAAKPVIVHESAAELEDNMGMFLVAWLPDVETVGYNHQRLCANCSVKYEAE